MSTLGKAVIELSAETAKFTGDIGRAAALFEKNMLGMERAVSGLLGKIGIVGGVAGIGLLTKNAIDLADHTFKASQKLSLTTEQISELGFAFKLADVDQNEFIKSFGKFEQALVKASNATTTESKVFKALGIDITKGPLVAFRQLSDAMSQLPADSELKGALASGLMGKGGAAMIPGMMEGSKGFDEAAIKARALGQVIGVEFGQAAQQYNDNMKILQSRSTELGITIATTLMPVLNDLVGRLAEASQHGRSGFFGELWKTTQRVAVSLTPDAIMPQWAQDEATRLFDTKGMVKPSGGQNVSGRIGGLKPVEQMGPPRPTSEQLKKLAAALSHNDEGARKAAAELLKYEGVAQGLTKQMMSLNNESQQTLFTYETTKGTLKDLTPLHKQQIIALAGELDKKKNAIEMSKQMVAAWEAEVSVMESSREKLQEMEMDQRAANKLQLEDMKFELDLIGKTSRDQEILNARRAIELQLRKEIAALPNDNSIQTSETQIRLTAEAEKQLQLVTKAIRDRQAAERDWSTGAKTAFNDYLDGATNMAQQTHDLFTNAFKGMEDALVEFATTGKLNFSKFAQSVIADLARIQIKAMMVKVMNAASDDGEGGDWSSLLSMFSSSGSSGVGAGGYQGAGMSSGSFGIGAGAADGGDILGGRAIMVGERGPEMFVPHASGVVVPNHDLGGGKEVNITFQVNTLDARTASSVLVENKEVIQSIIRSAINERGKRADF